MTIKKVLVTGFFDMLNSGHVSFLKEAASFGDLYVGIGSDSTFEQLKGRKPVASEQERLYMVKAVRHVKDAFINTGSGILDFLDTVEKVNPDILVVNSNGGNSLKEELCRQTHAIGTEDAPVSFYSSTSGSNGRELLFPVGIAISPSMPADVYSTIVTVSAAQF